MVTKMIVQAGETRQLRHCKRRGRERQQVCIDSEREPTVVQTAGVNPGTDCDRWH